MKMLYNKMLHGVDVFVNIIEEHTTCVNMFNVQGCSSCEPIKHE